MLLKFVLGSRKCRQASFTGTQARNVLAFLTCCCEHVGVEQQQQAELVSTAERCEGLRLKWPRSRHEC